MAHIADCMRYSPLATSHVYISAEASLSMPAIGQFKDGHMPQEEDPVKGSSRQAQPNGSSRYQLWPSMQSRTPVGIVRPAASLERLNALAMGRSSTSLSDTAIGSEVLPSWQRTPTLARRRKVSVPELGNTMTTVQEMAIDSPTIPGRPALQQTSLDVLGHERSSSAPGMNCRTGPFGDAPRANITGSSPLTLERAVPPQYVDFGHANRMEAPMTLRKPALSPIWSPGVLVKPTLTLDTSNGSLADDQPPQVPPKPAALTERRRSPSPKKQEPRPNKIQLPGSHGFVPWSVITPGSTSDAKAGSLLLPTPVSAISNPLSTGSPHSAMETRASPNGERRDPFSSPPQQQTHARNASESSVMERGRPVRRGSKRSRSRTCPQGEGVSSPTVGWKLPRGTPLSDAARISESERTVLHKQARDQAAKFEVLTKRDVASMSRELRALDERCDYLRKTYKSLRTGRQKLHSRMIAYLRRGETVIFSRESLLKQEEALAELDVSIDEFILKLEQAENCRLRLRQKLLEHVASALMLQPISRTELCETTPPRSPVKTNDPARIDRADVQSIKIYADGQVLNLYSDIEQAIGQMCEQTC